MPRQKDRLTIFLVDGESTVCFIAKMWSYYSAFSDNFTAIFVVEKKHLCYQICQGCNLCINDYGVGSWFPT